jgi:DNA-binding transcriptional ArsR family regulator
MADDASVRDLDPRSLRALAHPLRLAILATLRDFGPATASQLAQRLGESSGSTSYHLRQLAAYRFVAEDPARGTARERWWTSVDRETRLNRALLESPDPEIAGAAASLLQELARQHARALDTWLAEAPSWSPDWRRTAEMSDFQLRLVPERARELTERLHAVVRDYAEVPDTSVDAAHVRVQIQAFPRRGDPFSAGPGVE